MPEIKHNFTGGKMNKDLDERLVPNGEYRDAMNIEVLSSEGSDVGTVQNLLGNDYGCNTGGTVGLGYAVGSISDERNDTLYWFTTDSTTNQTAIAPTTLLEGLNSADLGLDDILNTSGGTHSLYDVNGNITTGIFPFKDAIRRKKLDQCRDVFVDVYGFITLIPDGNGVGTSGEKTAIMNLSDDVLQMVKEGWLVMGVDGSGITSNTTTVTGQDYLAGAFFTVNYDPGFQTYGGYAGNAVSLSAVAAGGKGANDPITFSLTQYPNLIYLPENAFVGGLGGFLGSPPPGASITLTNNVGNITLPNTTVVSSSVVNVEEYSGAGEFLVEIELSQPLTGNFYNDFSTHAAPNLTIQGGTPWSNTNLIDNGLSSSSSQTDLLYGSFNASVSYTAEYDTGIVRSDITISASFSFAGSWSVGDIVNPTYLYPNGGCIDSITTDINGDYSVVINDCNGNIILPMQASPHVNVSEGYLVVESDEVGVLYLEDGIDMLDITALVFSSPIERVLRFNSNKTITGINIIDDMLFWTDGHTEPKKISIPRSIRGTDDSGKRHTRLVNDDLDIGLDLPGPNLDTLVTEEHITVIKKSPIAPMGLEFSTGRTDGYSQSVQMLISNDTNISQSSFTYSSASNNIYNFSSLQAGDSFWVAVDLDDNDNTSFDLVDLKGELWKEGQEVALREYNDDGEVSLPVRNPRIKGRIGGWSDNNFNATPGSPAQFEVIIEFMEEDIPSAGVSGIKKFIIDILDSSENVFEFKFPRFSYRYKYEDGEYSTFAPFTEVAFLPGNFEFHPKEGYNLGMTNSIKELTLTDFNGKTTPLDVVSIDLLYKDDQSTNIYVVDTIKPKDEITPNPWTENSYTVTSDIIHRILPSNQLLRSWDTVPKTALAQEVIGNRLVYGNYTQGYDLKNKGVDIYPKFIHELTAINTDVKSIKSLREYQLGVVFVDKFGRETPVITNQSASFKVGKANARLKNKINVSFQGTTSGGSGAPSGMEFFKFYIKETSGEYYNMAMDRWYDAEDGGVWLSFASSDRNKIDIDTFLILKKGLESNELVADPARYKVLAIENEAPDFIKENQFNCGEIKQLRNNEKLYEEGVENIPMPGRNSFSGDLSRFGKTSLRRLDELIIDNDIYVDFYKADEVEMSTRKYRVTNCSKQEVDEGESVIHGSHQFTFNIDGYFEDDLYRILDGPNSSPTGINDSTVTRFYKGVKENSAKFDGKFFVKIHAAGSAFSTTISEVDLTEIDPNDYTTLAAKKVYFMGNDIDDIHTGAYNFKVFNNNNYVQSIMDLDHTSWHSGTSVYDADWLDTNWKYSIAKAIMYVDGELRRNIPEAFRMNQRLHNQSLWRDVPDKYQAFRAYFKNTITNLWNSDNLEERKQGTGTKKISEVGGIEQLADDLNGFIANSTESLTGNTVTMFGIQDDVLMRDANSDFGYEDVLFIDQGPFVYTNGWWDNGWRKRGFGNAGTRPGITNYNDSARMEISLGPIMPEKGIPYKDNPTLNPMLNKGSGLHSKWEYWSNMFDLHDDSRHLYNDSMGAKIMGNLESGTKFRWAEDPNGTIYTVFRGFTESARNRYEKFGGFEDVGSGGLAEVSPLINVDGYGANNVNYDPVEETGYGYYDWRSGWEGGGYLQDRINNPFYFAGENFTKNKLIYCYPSMDWEPTMQGVTGAIDNGKIIENFTFAGGTTLYNIGSRAGSWTDNTFEIHKTHFEGAQDTSGAAPTPSQITVGMLLTHVDTSAVTDITDSNGKLLSGGYLVKSITPPASGGYYYTIEFTGYTSIYSTSPSTSSSTAIMNDFNGLGTLDLRFVQPAMNGLSVNSVKNTISHVEINGTTIGIGAVGYTIEILEEIKENKKLPTNPAIWETEPKESTDLDIYYEVGGKNPILLNEKTIEAAIPLQSQVILPNSAGDHNRRLSVIEYYPPVSNTIILDDFICANEQGIACDDGNGGTIASLKPNDKITIIKPSGERTLVTVDYIKPANEDFGGADPLTAKVIRIKRNLYNNKHTLGWHNCYSFGNGVESNRIRDNFNLPYISNGVRASVSLEEFPREEIRSSGLIYSGIYNSNTGTNNLNQFIIAEKITKDVNPTYGSIQKLHTRDSDLLTLCQDKVLKILANKDAVFNADSNPQLVATKNVLGQTIPFVGEYGISTNPESFASEAYRAYFTDKVRGAVMRLSKDGLTPISDAGMRDWFRDNLKLGEKLIGSYDDRKNEYNLTLRGQVNKTVSFSEKVKGWVSFKSFVPENAISCANEYYTFNGNNIWKHHVENSPRNTFYGQHTPSSFNVLLNDQPSVVKSFETLNYEGTQGRIEEQTSYQVYIPGTIDPNTGIGVVNPDVPTLQSDGEYYNLEAKDGWYVENIKTDLEEGSLNEFIEKEGKWFNFIKGKADILTSSGTFLSEFDSSDMSFQGLGVIAGGVSIANVNGCTDQSALNWNQFALVDDGSCVVIIPGCMDANAFNFNTSANQDDGSCIYMGCTNPIMFNYDSNATTDDGSCTPFLYGCTNSTAYNWNNYANTDDGSCLAHVYGCTDPTATNYDPSANTDNDTCQFPVYGCGDPSACNYDPAVTNSDNSCTYCGDSAADNYDATGFPTCTSSCLYCQFNDPSFLSWSSMNPNPTDTTLQIMWENPSQGSPVDMTSTGFYEIRYRVVGAYLWNVHTMTALQQSPQEFTLQGLDQQTGYEIEVRSVCDNTTSDWSSTLTLTTLITPILGCTDATATNYNSQANTDDGTCIATILGCTDSGAMNYNSTANTDDGLCMYCVYGCTNNVMFNYDPNATCDDGSCIAIVNGCMDTTMFNYNPLANTDDGSCVAVSYGCTDPAMFNYDPNANTADGSCITIVGGCTDPAACNYDSLANTDDGSCFSCNNSSMFVNLTGGWNYDANIGNYLDAMTVVWNVSSTPDNSTSHRVKWKKSSDPWSGWNLITGLPSGNGSHVVVATFEENVDYDFQIKTICGTCTSSWSATTVANPGFNVGCTDATADNYDPNASVDDGSCTYSTPPGCQNSAADNYDPNATNGQNFSCVWSTPTGGLGCTDPTQSNWNPNATIDDGSCQPFTYGCTDATATNYNSIAMVDDGSCIWLGCTDPIATNFDPIATVNDGSCTY